MGRLARHFLYPKERELALHTEHFVVFYAWGIPLFHFELARVSLKTFSPETKCPNNEARESKQCSNNNKENICWQFIIELCAAEAHRAAAIRKRLACKITKIQLNFEHTQTHTTYHLHALTTPGSRSNSDNCDNFCSGREWALSRSCSQLQVHQ